MQTRKMREGEARVKAIARAKEEGMPALASMEDFGAVMNIVGHVLTAQFTGNGRDTPEGKGLRAISFRDFEYSNMIYVPGEDDFKTGWRARLNFVLDTKLSPMPVLRALERYGIRPTTGAHPKPGVDIYDLSYKFDVYILSDDYATMAVRRRFAGLDSEPGPTNLRMPRS